MTFIRVEPMSYEEAHKRLSEYVKGKEPFHTQQILRDNKTISSQHIYHFLRDSVADLSLRRIDRGVYMVIS